VSVYNLCDTVKDEAMIIDSKGIKQGLLLYKMNLELLESDGKTKLDIIDYDSLNQKELLDKILKIHMEVTRATEIPEKYSFQTQAKYEWIDDEKTNFETKVVKKNKSPEFSYKNTH